MGRGPGDECGRTDRPPFPGRVMGESVDGPDKTTDNKPVPHPITEHPPSLPPFYDFYDSGLTPLTGDGRVPGPEEAPIRLGQGTREDP